MRHHADLPSRTAPQVGIIALNLIGDQTPPQGAPGYLDTSPAPLQQPYYNRAAAADLADLNLDMHVDPTTAAKIRELVAQKDAAVANEEYDEAKRLKASIERLKVRRRAASACGRRARCTALLEKESAWLFVSLGKGGGRLSRGGFRRAEFRCCRGQIRREVGRPW